MVVMDMMKKIKLIVDEYADETLDILMYYPLSDEVDLRPLFPKLIEDGHHVYFPVTGKSDMQFYEVKSLNDFVSGSLGVLEPSTLDKKYCYDRRKTICLTPGTKFSASHQRKGRGKGYYDRFFAGKDDIYKVGITTESQILPELDSKPWDVDMDVVVTSERVF